MGVYIKGMTLEEFSDYGDYCQTLIGTGQAEELPPHGRLIDADALEVVVEAHYKHHKISRYDRDLLLHYLDVEMAPTIIPAKEGK